MDIDKFIGKNYKSEDWQYQEAVRRRSILGFNSHPLYMSTWYVAIAVIQYYPYYKDIISSELKQIADKIVGTKLNIDTDIRLLTRDFLTYSKHPIIGRRLRYDDKTICSILQNAIKEGIIGRDDKTQNHYLIIDANLVNLPYDFKQIAPQFVTPVTCTVRGPVKDLTVTDVEIIYSDFYPSFEYIVDIDVKSEKLNFTARCEVLVKYRQPL